MLETAAAIRSSSTGVRRRAAFVGNALFRNEAFGRNHPLSISRQAGVMDLCAMLGWLDEAAFHECQPATDERLAEFHDSDYLRALRAADDRKAVSVQTRERHGVGTMENPLFEGLYERAACTVGGSILAAELALEGRVAFHPAGGTHHGRRDRAAGFCYFNDPVFAVRTLLDGGVARVMYLDLDAHHGDGVQAAFEGDERVLTLSIHERDRWPYSGPVEDRGAGFARNLPVPPGFNDSELAFLMNEVAHPLLQDFDPGALVITCGADGLDGDPLSKMALSNRALWDAVAGLVERRARAVVLGGGGYNPWTTIRCWAGLWGVLSGRELPARLPAEARALLARQECDLVDEEDLAPAWLETLADAPNTGPVRADVRRVAATIMESA